MIMIFFNPYYVATLLIFLLYSCAVLGDLGDFENVFASISTNLHTHVVGVYLLPHHDVTPSFLCVFCTVANFICKLK